MPTKHELLEEMTVEDLMEMARDKGLQGYSTKRKQGLINMIEENYQMKEIETWPETEGEMPSEKEEPIKFLCTSDLHLKEDEPERIEGLKEILSIAADEEVNYILVAGDLFNKEIDASQLRGDIRGIFSDLEDMTMLIVPGNHDENAYPQGTHLGEKVEILSERPYDTYLGGEIDFIGIPFPEREFDEADIPRFFEILNRVEIDSEKPKVVITHGRLVGGAHSYPAGAGKEERDNPIHVDDLKQTDFDFFALGHIHQPKKRLLEVEGRIRGGYPGSPVSIDKDETGQRKVIIGILKNGSLEFIEKELNTYHVVRNSLFVIPDKEEEGLRELEKMIELHREPPAQMQIEVRGFTAWREDDFIEAVDEIIDNSSKDVIRDEEKTEVTNIGKVSSPTLEAFLDKLDDVDYIDENVREEVVEVFCKSFIDVEGKK